MTEPFNAATYLTQARVDAGDGHRVAVRHPRGTLTYTELTAEVRRVAAGLTAIGVRPEERVLLVMVDDVELLAGILAAMHVGAVAVPCSTMLTGGELAKLVVDSRARALLGSQEFAANVEAAAAAAPDLRHVVLTGDIAPGTPVTNLTWDDLRGSGQDGAAVDAYPTWDESPALWLYTSGTTGTPKGAMHRHTDIRHVCETYGRQVLGISPDDVCLSAAKLFFAYGIGNSMFFPLSVGAMTVLEPARPNPGLYAELIRENGVTLFFGGPSFWGPLMAADLPRETFASVRNGVSAGEALPARMYHGVLEQYGFEILDGIGSTEALHIFISNVAGNVVAGSSGFPVPGYRIELRREDDGTVIDGAGEPGMLYVAGDSICTGYWCRTDVNRAVFHGEWMRTGDQYVRNDDGSLTCLGRANDVLKVGGIWVSPTEVETRLLEHPSLAEAVVVGVPDEDGLDKPIAFVVPRPGRGIDPEDIIAFCKAGLASFKRPRVIVEVAELPKTATGKIQRFKLRELAGTSVTPPATTAADVAETKA